MSNDISVLCAAIDAGDDTALPILADALEEVGDARAAGLLYVQPSCVRLFSNRVGPPPSFWGWQTNMEYVPGGSEIPPQVYDCLPEAPQQGAAGTARWSLYPTRSAAYLALAEALMENQR